MLFVLAKETRRLDNSLLDWQLGTIHYKNLLEDYKQAMEQFPEDELISSIYAALCLSQKAISQDPRQVVPQLLGRLEEDKVFYYY